MDSYLASIFLVASLIVLAWCLLSLLDHSKKGQVLYRLWR